MRKSRLILVDGLTGSGKSTTSEFIARRLILSKFSADWIGEWEHGHPLHAWGDFSVDWFARTAEENAANHFRVASLDKIKRFVQNRIDREGITVVECYPFQSLALFLHLAGDGEEAIRNHIIAIMQIFEPLALRIIYLRQCDPEASLKQVIAERGDGYHGLIKGLLARAYRCQGSSSHSDDLSFFAEFQDLTDRLFGALDVPKLTIEIERENWEAHYGKITDFLGLPPSEGGVQAED
jgi:hypothetical protein